MSSKRTVISDKLFKKKRDLGDSKQKTQARISKVKVVIIRGTLFWFSCRFSLVLR